MDASSIFSWVFFIVQPGYVYYYFHPYSSYLIDLTTAHMRCLFAVA
jgi:hypothetical protein